MRRRASSAALLAASLLLVTGCASEQIVKPTLDRRRWLGDWDKAVREVGARRPPEPLTLLHRGDQLEIYLLGLRPQERLPAPTDARGEVLVVVEGGGNVAVAGKPQPVQYGDVLVLPAGTRGLARGSPELPLLALLVRARAAPAPDAPALEPRLLTFDQVFPRSDDASPERVIRHTLGVLPGQLSLHSITVKGGSLPRHVHYAHDEFVMMIDGFGTFGWGDDNGPYQSTRGFVSAPFDAKGMAYIPTRVPHSYEDEANPTRALTFFGPDFEEGERDFYLVPDSDKAKQGDQVNLAPKPAQGVERAEGSRPLTPARRVKFVEGSGPERDE